MADKKPKKPLNLKPMPIDAKHSEATFYTAAISCMKEAMAQDKEAKEKKCVLAAAAAAAAAGRFAGVSAPPPAAAPSGMLLLVSCSQPADRSRLSPASGSAR